MDRRIKIERNAPDLRIPLRVSDLILATRSRSHGREEMGGGLTVVVNSGEAQRLWIRRRRRCRGPQWRWSARRDPEECGDLTGVVGVVVHVQWRGGGVTGEGMGGRSFGCGSPSVSGCTITQEVSSRRCAR
jgi:hypothetical protein